MKSFSPRRATALVALLTTFGLAAACTPDGGIAAPPVPTGNYQFKANSVTVNASNDKTCFIVCVGANDEPFVINVAFTVKVGEANSAQAWVVTGANAWPGVFDQGPGEGSSHTFSGTQQGTVTFANVPKLDVLDLLFPTNHLQIAGVWSWAMEADLLGVGGLATTSAAAIKSVLNSVLANVSAPIDANALVSQVISAVTSNLLPALGGLLASIIPFAGDDAIGSRMYIGLGARDTLKAIADAALSAVTLPPLAIPALDVPPDINGGSIFTLDNRSFTGQVMTNSGVDGRHTYSSSMSAI